MYGVKTALGIPVDTPLVGRIVVSLYSTFDAPEDTQLVQNCVAELARYAPAPKWHLAIDAQGNSNDSRAEPQPDTTQRIMAMNISSQPMQLGGCSPRARSTQNEEQEIIALLGEHMMPGAGTSAGESSSSSSSLLPHFMSIRLLLLRPEARRSQNENEMIEILTKSYRAYAKDNRRSGSELASLLANDWICLKTSLPSPIGLSSPLMQRSSSIASLPSAVPYSNTQVVAPLMAPYGVSSGPMSQPHLSQGSASAKSTAVGHISTTSLQSNVSAYLQGSPSSQNLPNVRPEPISSSRTAVPSQAHSDHQQNNEDDLLLPRPLPPKHTNVVPEN